MVRSAIFLIVMLGVVLFFFAATDNLKEGSREEEKKQLEEAIRKTVVACYATEGVYPPDLAYVKEHYGLQINEERYLVVYDIFAENLMPEITVLERNYEE
jgi:hypothetical protein